MAKTSQVARNQKRIDMSARLRTKRETLRKQSVDMKLPVEERVLARQKLAALPRNSAYTRVRRRCLLSGRSRGNLKKFMLSRLMFRDLASKGEISGVRKASW